MILIACLSVAIYLIIGVVWGLYLYDEKVPLTKWDWFWIITSWVSILLILLIEYIVEQIKKLRND